MYEPLTSDCQISMNALRTGAPFSAKQAPREMRDLADGRREPVVHDQEIVVGVERQAVGVVGAVARDGRRQRLRERARVPRALRRSSVTPRMNCRRVEIMGNPRLSAVAVQSH